MATILKEETTLKGQQESLETENVVLGYLVYIEVPLGILLTLYGLYGYFAQDSLTFLVFGLIVVGLGGSHHMKINENEESIEQIKSGRSGEADVSRMLDDELPESFYLLNDLDVQSAGRDAQNDHLVIAPGGIFVVETKAYAGTLTGHADDDQWTQEKRDSTKSVTNPIQQNDYHREVLLEVLNRHNLPFEKDDVHSLIAMTNGSCDLRIQGNTDNVHYASQVPEQIRTLGDETKYSRETRDQLVEILGLEPPEGNLSSKAGNEKLGQDTQEETLPGQSSDTSEAKPKAERTSGEMNQRKWWVYRKGSVSDRAYSLRELQQMNLNPDTQVCPEDTQDWIRAAEVDGLTFK